MPPRLRALVLGQAEPAQRRWLQAAMAAGLLLAGGVIGALLGRHWRDAESAAPLAAASAPANGSGWVQRAAFAHSVYVPEPRHAVEVKAQEEHLARWLTRRIDVPVKLFDLRDQGFELVGGRLLPDGPGKSAQLMYQDAQGIAHHRLPAQARCRHRRRLPLRAAGRAWACSTGSRRAPATRWSARCPRSSLLALAQEIYRQHPAAGAASAPAAAASR